MSKTFNSETSLDDVFDDPKSFGLPSFDDCLKKPELLTGRDDESLAQADKGSVLLREVRKHVYFIEGVQCRKIEEVERIALDMGLNIRDLEYVCEMPNRETIHVKYFHKNSLKKRNKW